MIRVLLAEDQAMVRGALASLLDLEPDIEVVAQVARGDEVLAAAQSRPRPTSPCSTSRCRERPGSRPPTELRRALPGLPDPDPDHVRAARLPAARDGERARPGSCSRTRPPANWPSAIRRAVAGERVVDPGLAAAALSQGESPLTPREHEVLAASREHATVADLARRSVPVAGHRAQPPLVGRCRSSTPATAAEAVQLAEEKGWL